jgi:hypothetical protein
VDFSYTLWPDKRSRYGEGMARVWRGGGACGLRDFAEYEAKCSLRANGKKEFMPKAFRGSFIPVFHGLFGA